MKKEIKKIIKEFEKLLQETSNTLVVTGVRDIEEFKQKCKLADKYGKKLLIKPLTKRVKNFGLFQVGKIETSGTSDVSL